MVDENTSVVEQGTQGVTTETPEQNTSASVVVEQPIIPEPKQESVLPKPEPTGNEYFDMVQDVMYANGIDHRKYWDEVYANDKLSDTSRAELVEKLGEPQVRMMESGLSKELANKKASQAAEAQKVYDAAVLPGFTDGKAAFDAIAEWSKTGISKEERVEFNSMLAKGGVQAKLAINALKERYMQDPNFSASSTMAEGTGVPGSPAVELISRSVYVEELRKAENKKDRAAIDKLNTRAKYTMANNPDVWRPY